jgi:hypothetical protein
MDTIKDIARMIVEMAALAAIMLAIVLLAFAFAP